MRLSKLPMAAALALLQLGIGGYLGPDAAFATGIFDELHLKGRGPIAPAEDEWSESPRHLDTIQLSGHYGIDLTVYYEDSDGRKETVKSFHRLIILKDGFEIVSDGQSTKFPLNGRMSKKFAAMQRSTMMNCFTMSTSYRIALECTIATKDQSCVGDFVWKFIVQFNPAGQCTSVTTDQHGGHDCEGNRNRTAFHNTAFACSRLRP